MTCTEASIRYAGDYAYRKQVDAGTATAEKEVFAKPVKVKPVKVVKPPVVKPPKPVREPKPKPVKAPRPPKPPKPVKVSRTYKTNRVPRVLADKPHGTTQAQRRACEGDCPNEESCADKLSRMRAEQKAARANTEFPEGKHGTLAGYSDGCHKHSPCPGNAEGKTCSQVSAKYQLSVAHRRRDNKAASASAGAVSVSTEGEA
ncbi:MULTISPECIES: hypothetical protein [unclassified Cryobacterium]|uniref:hypothetical protein n=1 Tax=unclassified Cryobacterium TaxID=2649013 RepID=UPI00106988BA|nr:MULTISPECIES: hypothetical protein [unclassified Cryobacterium]TFC59449.1 hypothetical protein E3O68_00685 [Cryobacterium sp. TMB3-1-2]TFC67245.1 hypothetical protein E3T21_17380 [Cryobacterium sp. TMB3-15]TFC73242.1 hypothetical protein E3T22_16675 [Cryobacterium sp. TMB3-10]TFD46130.1 hypothetical protein E3T58_01310 [Cryobacterium sp. TMB3-12]